MMKAWLSWAIFLAIGGIFTLYYRTKNNRGRHRGRTTQRATTSSAKADIQWSDSESTPKPNAKPAKAKAPRKSVKKAVQEAGDKAGAYLSAASSTTGADADDDLSPATSPTRAAAAPSGRDVSDMLEPTGVAPAILKISSSEKPGRQTKLQQQRPETPQETKKQRQNRRKAEEAKAQREADEKARQILLEKQRRTAREARGEPAKNGLQAAKAPTTNPWATPRASAAAGATLAPAPPQGGQLLDTFDPEVVSTTSSSENATNGTVPTPDSPPNQGHWANLPSEQEQLRMALEESAWTTVPKGGKKQRKTKTAGDTTGEEGSVSGDQQEPASIKPVPSKKAENVPPPRSRFDILSDQNTDANSSHPMDSDWPVV
ncbi:hypothetical protein CC78DRAFT_541955 [Lojkania enalia]|uniref:Uncharacterized protein n=1 Tax=Lojkania enalia TaxID=147567 RepID=A0A9P4KF26_9PLEO|nr:hypothetical protein CC78DRAFT_541955 [Didymosphaeria enalia]